MKIFILGGKGFVGSAFVRFCQREKKDYAIVDLDNYEQMKGKKCEILINADGNSRKYVADENPAEDFRLSVLSVLQAFKDFDFKKYVYISSVDVYPDHSQPENNGEEATIDIERLTRYGFHKYLAEQLVKHYTPHWLIIRLGGVLGPGLKKNPVFDLLHDIPLRVHEDSCYQYVTTDLMAKIVFQMVKRNWWGEVVNVCGRGTVSLKEIRSWLNKPLKYFKKDVPVEKYEVSNKKLGRIITVPHSREVAKGFIHAPEDPR